MQKEALGNPVSHPVCAIRQARNIYKQLEKFTSVAAQEAWSSLEA
jgi:hypothetical protein